MTSRQVLTAEAVLELKVSGGRAGIRLAAQGYSTSAELTADQLRDLAAACACTAAELEAEI